MRILVDNYVSETTTEPVYLDRCFKMAGAESHLWDRNRSSLYDTFDEVRPDVFVTDYKRIDPTLSKYLSQSTKPISVVVNVTGSGPRQLEAINDFLTNSKAKSPFCFTNIPESVEPIQKSPLRVESIMHGADIFLPIQPPLKYQIDVGVMAVGGFDPALYKHGRSKHVINAGATEDYDFDTNIPIHQGPSIYGNYDKVVLVGSLSRVFTQRFFDVAFHAKEFSVYLEDDEQIKTCVKTTELLKMNNVNSRIPILRSHTALHRAKRFLQKLKCSEMCKNLDKAIGGLE